MHQLLLLLLSWRQSEVLGLGEILVFCGQILALAVL
jgi:hypothetical protein